MVDLGEHSQPHSRAEVHLKLRRRRRDARRARDQRRFDDCMFARAKGADAQVPPDSVAPSPRFYQPSMMLLTTLSPDRESGGWLLDNSYRMPVTRNCLPADNPKRRCVTDMHAPISMSRDARLEWDRDSRTSRAAPRAIRRTGCQGRGDGRLESPLT